MGFVHGGFLIISIEILKRVSDWLISLFYFINWSLYISHPLPHSVPTTALESVKEWLNQSDIYYCETSHNFDWIKNLKLISDDPAGFVDNGAWKFIAGDSDEENADEDDEEDDDESFHGDSGSDVSFLEKVKK